jgi:hypothetical protein
MASLSAENPPQIAQILQKRDTDESFEASLVFLSQVSLVPFCFKICLICKAIPQNPRTPRGFCGAAAPPR